MDDALRVADSDEYLKKPRRAFDRFLMDLIDEIELLKHLIYPFAVFKHYFDSLD